MPPICLMDEQLMNNILEIRVKEPLFIPLGANRKDCNGKILMDWKLMQLSHSLYMCICESKMAGRDQRKREW